jgi:hypothetical protein
MRHLWKNLKNSWEEYSNVEGWFIKSSIDNYIAIAFFIWVILVIIFTFIGCTTLKHEPSCICDCIDNLSHFECGGKHYYEEVEF